MMSAYLGVVKKSNRPYLEAIADDIKARRDKNFFWPTGTQVYCGIQGSGKTISAVKHIHDLKQRYPHAILVSNLQLQTFEAIAFDSAKSAECIAQVHEDKAGRYLLFRTMSELAQVLTKVNNGRMG